MSVILCELVLFFVVLPFLSCYGLRGVRAVVGGLLESAACASASGPFPRSCCFRVGLRHPAQQLAQDSPKDRRPRAVQLLASAPVAGRNQRCECRGSCIKSQNVLNALDVLLVRFDAEAIRGVPSVDMEVGG